MKKAYFQYYETFEKIVQKFKDEAQQDAFRKKIINYGLFGIEPELTELEDMVWEVVKDMIDSQMHRREVNAANRTGAKAPTTVEIAPEIEDHDINAMVYMATKQQEEPAEEPKKEPAKRFVKPTVEEIKAYCDERYNSVNPQQFYDFYESKDWRVGANKMKDWKAAVRTWEQRDDRRPAAPPRQNTRQLPEDRLTL